MTRRRHTPGQFLQRLRDMGVLYAEGCSIGEIAKRVEVGDQTLHRWRSQIGGINGVEMKRLVADFALDSRMLNDLAEGDS